MSAGYDGVIQGPGPLDVILTSSEPPRLWGDGCGCKRVQWRANHWTLRLCERHAREYLGLKALHRAVKNSP